MNSRVPALYISPTQLLPGQTRYSSKAVQAKVHKYIKRGDAEWDGQLECWTGKYERGDSIFSPDNTVPVIRSAHGFVLVDGHHDVLASIYFNVPLVPITIVDDLSHLEDKEFWPQAEKQGWVYLYTIRRTNSPDKTQEKQKIIIEHSDRPPATFAQLIDDPLRYFASTTARKFRVATDPIQASQGAEYPLWIKIGKDVPFIEFALADMLYKHGFEYYYSDGAGDTIPENLVEQARKILVNNPVSGLRLIPERQRFDQLSLSPYL